MTKKEKIEQEQKEREKLLLAEKKKESEKSNAFPRLNTDRHQQTI